MTLLAIWYKTCVYKIDRILLWQSSKLMVSTFIMKFMDKVSPLVLIAGFSADHNAWCDVVDYLSQHYRVIIFDNRGASQSEVPPGPYSIEQLANDTVNLCLSLGIKQAHFIGNSMGA